MILSAPERRTRLVGDVRTFGILNRPTLNWRISFKGPLGELDLGAAAPLGIFSLSNASDSRRRELPLRLELRPAGAAGADFCQDELFTSGAMGCSSRVHKPQTNYLKLVERAVTHLQHNGREKGFPL